MDADWLLGLSTIVLSFTVVGVIVTLYIHLGRLEAVFKAGRERPEAQFRGSRERSDTQHSETCRKYGG